jgi:hypothetical protein
VQALHGTRLQMMLSKTIDTTVRGVVYELAGTVESAVLAAGAAELRRTCELNEIPFALLDADPANAAAWAVEARAAIDGLLGV